MAGNRPEERVVVPAVTQSWRQVAFLHWRVDPAAVQSLLPAGLCVDLVDGDAWLGLTPFRVERMRVLGVLPTRASASFPETNLRTYVRDERGRDGIWFLSIDVADLASLAGGRAIGAPYHLSSMAVDDDDNGGALVRYRCRRRSSDVGHDISVRPGARIADDDLSPTLASLVGRWRALTLVGGRQATVAVQHEPWPVHEADLVDLDEDLSAAAGLPAPSSRPMVHWSPGVNVRLGAMR